MVLQNKRNVQNYAEMSGTCVILPKFAFLPKTEPNFAETEPNSAENGAKFRRK